MGALTEASYRARGLEHEDYALALRAADRRAAEAELLVAEQPATGPGGTGRLVGTVTFCPPGSVWCELATGTQAELRMLAVDPSAQGRGIGEHLARACVARARELGCSALVLSSPSTVPAAHRLYLRLGFERRPQRDWSPAPGVALLAYVLPLS